MKLVLDSKNPKSKKAHAASARAPHDGSAKSTIYELGKISKDLAHAVKQAEAMLKKGNEDGALRYVQDYEDIINLWNKS